MNHKLKSLLLFSSVVLLAVSCKSEFDMMLNSNDIDSKYEAAFKFYNKEKYHKAASLFESLTVLTTGTEKDDTVQYYWALSNYKYKDYYTAETNFKKFLDNFPRSPFSADASYYHIDCIYRQTLRYELDQTITYRAISAISEYIVEFPKSEKIATCKEMLDDLNIRLDKKAFEAAKLYYNIEDFLAARVALANVLKDDSDNVYREDILYLTAMSSYKYAALSVKEKQKERYLAFVDDYLYFVGENPESKYRRELDNLYQRSQKALGKYTGDIEKIKEKDFEKERQMLQGGKHSAALSKE